MKGKPEASAPQPSKSKPKGTVLDQLKIRRAEQAALAKKARPVAAVLSVQKSQPPPQPTQPAQPAQPLPVAGEQTAEGNLLEILFARALRNRTDTKPGDDPGMAMLQALAHQVQTGQPLKDIENVVVPHLGEMSAKIHLFLNAMAYHNMFERGSLLSLARWTLEKSLWEDLIQQKLSPIEKLALLQLAIKEMDKVQDNIGDFQGTLDKGGKGTASDIESATQRSDKTLQKIADPAAKLLDGTSATGRELARRILHQAGQNAEKIVEDTLKAKPA